MEPKIKGKAFDYDDTRDRKFYDAFVWMFHPLAKIIFKTQFIGRENVPMCNRYWHSLEPS